MNGASLLSVRDLRVRRGGRSVLDGVGLEVGASEVVALMGTSGSGKSTLVRAILGLLTPDEGSISLDGHVLAESGRNLIAPFERGLAVVFQDLALWPHLTVGGNLDFGLRALGLPRAEREARAERMLRRVGLEALRGRHPDELSGGERQRVAIARALVGRPKLVLLDEPLSNLDVGLKRELLALFAELLAAERSSALFITHDVREAAALARRVVVIDDGRIVQKGTLESVSREPVSQRVRELLGHPA
jgi:iron(III) transport system ATP-binding protein